MSNANIIYCCSITLLCMLQHNVQAEPYDTLEALAKAQQQQRMLKTQPDDKKVVKKIQQVLKPIQPKKVKSSYKLHGTIGLDKKLYSVISYQNKILSTREGARLPGGWKVSAILPSHTIIRKNQSSKYLYVQH
jgi:hypothetical protein